MAHASRKHFGPGAQQGKGDGTGAMTTVDTADIPDNMVLSNRDKAQHGDVRGLDSRAIQTEQLRDHSANRRLEEHGEERDDDRIDDAQGEALGGPLGDAALGDADGGKA